MNLLEAIQARHSVRQYTLRPIEGETLAVLSEKILECNQKSGLNIQLITNEPEAFGGTMARYGKFTNVHNYIALVGQKGGQLEESCGYYGEKLVLCAQQLGLNTCWVALTYSKGKSAATLKPGEKLLMVIAIGYGQTQGNPRNTKPVEALCRVNGDMPPWFLKAMEAVQLAPTATNQQKFVFEIMNGDQVKATPGTGFYTKTDLGIAKCHFEIGAADAQGPLWRWA